MSDKSWTVTNEDASFETLRDKNTVYTISNGYYAMKGNVHEYRHVDHNATYIAGVWGRCDIFGLESPTKYHRIYHDYDRYDTAEEGISIANLPDPLAVRIFVDGRMLSFGLGAVRNFVQEYHLDRGLYEYRFTHILPDGKETFVSMQRFADMEHLHRAYMRYKIKPLNYEGVIRVESGIDADTKSNLLSVRQYEVREIDAPDPGVCHVGAQTAPLGHRTDFYTAHRLWGTSLSEEVCCEEDKIYNVFRFGAKAEEEILFDKYIALSSGEDEKYDAKADAREELRLALAEGVDAARRRTKEFWARKWEDYDVQIAGDELAQLYLRFDLFHLISGAPRHTSRLFMPVKLLTGDHYQGTAFYDTDLYIEPVFLAIEPQLAKQLVTFRHNILDRSRKIAVAGGYPGAKYAWQVAPWGDEVLGSWWKLRDTNIHLNVDICYSIMQYYYHTEDLGFVADKAIDIMVEVSRFMAARGEFGPDGAFHIDGVAGPDEAHCNSRDNFYTNYLAKQCWLNTAKLLETLQQEMPDAYREITERLDLKTEEPEAWRRRAEKIRLIYHPDRKLYEQAEGFFELPLIPKERWEVFHRERKPRAGMWFADLDRYGQTNQPDASAAIWMYPEHFDRETYEANYRFYDARNCNFSSMSYVVNAMMAAYLGQSEEAYRNFIISAGMDLDPNLTNRMDTRAGLHGTALGGGWMACIQGFGGLRVTENGMSVAPQLPSGWDHISFNYNYAGAKLHFLIDQKIIRVTAVGSGDKEIRCSVNGENHILFGAVEKTIVYR